MSDLGFSTWLPDSDEAACFYSHFNLQKYSKIDSSSFWHDLGFGGSQFPFKIPLKKYSKIDFSSFWHNLGFGGSFFPFKVQFSKSIEKLIFSSFWHDLGFGGSLFLFKIQWKNIQKMFFPSFGTILVLVAAFVYKKTTKNAKNTKRIPFPTFLITVFLIFQLFLFTCLFMFICLFQISKK